METFENLNCYGFAVHAEVHPLAAPLVADFFNPARPVGRSTAQEPVRLRIDVVEDSGAPTVEPPHTEEVIAATPIVIDTGRSRAAIVPDEMTIDITLARSDLDDPIVWGRWMFERAFLYLVCRSARHYPFHAGGFELDGRQVLLSAPTGTGKSTFGYWAARNGAVLAGEDIMVRAMDDASRSVVGLPQVMYLDAGLFDRCGELSALPRAAVDEGRKFRVSWTGRGAVELAPRLEPEVLVFLRHGEPEVRTVGLDEAVDRCRDDVLTGKSDDAVCEAVESDLRSLLQDMPILELGLSLDFDASLAALRRALKEL